ncbi:response regulator transcription factor [Portibacter lacus]|uniref:DNA-binding response regulator n=1 Tax=Portibacter lacus TaxID=1099794 RepID=A0AA37SSB3_9BACT|nr:response regulator transcription factor [Portibacter lacus]GLR19493.1 DNA-binding response regulator [Portibacter lacus]
MKEIIKVAIVDDSKVTLRNLAELIDYDKEIKISGTYSRARIFLDAMKRIDKSEYPDVVLTDIDMPDMNGVNMILVAKAQYPEIKFLILTVHDDESFLFDAIKVGASGYLLKDDKISILINQIKTLIRDGGAPMSPIIARKTLDLVQRIPESKGKVISHELPELTEREIEILKLMVAGHNYEQIATIIHVTKNTVKKHISNMYNKLHISSKAQAIKIANRNGLI